jgi:sugar phosphate isomerase/epimerase
LRFSLSTGTLYVYPLSWVLRLARETGFDGVELVVNPEVIVRRGQAVRRLAEAEGIEIVSVHPTVIPLPGWREQHSGAVHTIRLAQEAGAGLVVLHTPHAQTLDEGEGLAFRQRIESWRGRLAGSDLKLAIENKAVRDERERQYALTPLAQLRAFADRYDVGLVFDTTHAASAGEDLLRAREVFDGRLVNVHLSDMGGHIPLSGFHPGRMPLAEHRLPGTGDLPLSALLAALSQEGYAGPVTLEVNPFMAHFWWPPTVRRQLIQVAEWMKRVTGNQELA